MQKTNRTFWVLTLFIKPISTFVDIFNGVDQLWLHSYISIQHCNFKRRNVLYFSCKFNFYYKICFVSEIWWTEFSHFLSFSLLFTFYVELWHFNFNAFLFSKVTNSDSNQGPSYQGATFLLNSTFLYEKLALLQFSPLGLPLSKPYHGTIGPECKSLFSIITLDNEPFPRSI